MKRIGAVLVSLMLLINMCSEITLAAETDNKSISVDYSISEEVLQLNISNISVVHDRQLLSVSLIHKDADVDNVSLNDILYSKSIYLNGRHSVTIDIDFGDAKITEYCLLINDSHAGIKYSQLLAVKVKTYTAQQYEEFCETHKNEGPKESGYVFAGWFVDETCEIPLTKNNLVKTAYAKYVDAQVLSVQAQISEEKNGKTDIRFVTTVDSIHYKKVGFYVSYDMDGDGINSKSKAVSNKVYRSLFYVDATNGEIMEYYPDKEFSSMSKYFKTVTVTGVPETHYDMEFKITPFWITLDGTTVYGETTIKTVSMGGASS